MARKTKAQKVLETHMMAPHLGSLPEPGQPQVLFCGRCGADETLASEASCQEVLPGA